MNLSDLIRSVIDLITLAVFAWVVLSWVRAAPGHPLGRVQSVLDRLMMPIVTPIRRILPPVRLGGGALDLSPIALIIILRILRGLF